jgi:hypothetical protein
METKEYEEFLENNPILYDYFEKEKNNEDIIDDFFTRFEQLFISSENYTSLISDEFACIFSGPKVITPSLGFEPYIRISDIISLAFYIYSQFTPEKTKEKQAKLFDRVVDISSHFVEGTSIYEAFIRAIDTHRPDYIDENAMLFILSKMRYSLKPPSVSFDVFLEYVHIASIGQLLNIDIGSTYRTELILSEIRKGLRNDKTNGIPSDSIVDFFTDPDYAFKIKDNFDIDLLVINLYIMLYNVGDLEAYINKSLNNYDSKFTQENKLINNETIANQIRSHYINMQRIFDALIKIQGDKDIYSNKLTTFGIKYYTVAYIILNAPLQSFFVRSSYEKVMDKFFIMCNSNVRELEYYYYTTGIINIIKLIPNINIPIKIIDTIFSGEDGFEKLKTGLQLGFFRYAYYLTKNIEGQINCLPNDNDNTLEYLNMNYIERIQYLVSDKILRINERINHKCLESNDKKDCSKCSYGNKIANATQKGQASYSCSLKDSSLEYAIYNLKDYTDFNLPKVLKDMNKFLIDFKERHNLVKNEEKALEPMVN